MNMQVIFSLGAEETRTLIVSTFTGSNAYGGGANGWQKPDHFEYFKLGRSKWHEEALRLPEGNHILVSEWPSSTVEVRHLPDTNLYLWRYQGGRQSREEFLKAAAALRPQILFHDTNALRDMEWYESLPEYVKRVGIQTAVARIIEQGGNGYGKHVLRAYHAAYAEWSELVELFSSWPKGQQMMLQGKEMVDITIEFRDCLSSSVNELVLYTEGVDDSFEYNIKHFEIFMQNLRRVQQNLPQFDFRLALST